MSVIMRDCIGLNARRVFGMFGPRSPVACYVNGPNSVWTPQEEHLFGEKIRIAVYPGMPEQARVARVLDASLSDRGDATPGDVPAFVHSRFTYGHSDATPYTDLDTLVHHVDTFLTAPRLWLAWWWERGEPTSRAPLWEELVRLGLHEAQATAVIELTWAWQFAAPGAGLPSNAFWDESMVFGKLDWSR